MPPKTSQSQKKPGITQGQPRAHPHPEAPPCACPNPGGAPRGGRKTVKGLGLDVVPELL